MVELALFAEISSKFLFVYARGGLAIKSKLHIHGKVCLGQHFLAIKFHSTSSVCLCVGYKMKACTQISDFGFRGKINLVIPGDSAKRGSPCKRQPM